MGSRCGAFSRKASRCAATSPKSSSSLGRRAFASSTVKSLGKEGSTFSSAAMCQPVGEDAGEAGGPDLGLSLLHVVFDEAVGDLRSIRRVLGEDVGGEGVSVPWLTDGARIDEVGPLRRQVERWGAGRWSVRRRGDGLNVRVPEEADPNLRILRLK